MDKWQYMTVRIENLDVRAKDLDYTLGKASADGWELVSLAPIVHGNIMKGRLDTTYLLLVFKRPTPDTGALGS